MAAIKSMDRIARKWATVTPQRAGDYKEGVENPRSSWQTKTLAAAGNWETGTQNAITEKRFASGVSKAGDAKWLKGAAGKGALRWGPGVAGAEEEFHAGFAPIHAAIASANLPARYATGDPRNIERVRAIDLVISAAARKKK